ncbi:MAG: succinylglutamate desuccinylase/aspartoacylase family protein [Bryobacteraceae bacterium]
MSFDPQSFTRNGKYRDALDLGFTKLPVLLVRGAEPGATLVVTGAVHGDEYEGVRAILETFEELDPAGMRGDLLAVPVANPPAFWNGTRSSPIDNGNLARVFPGDPNGPATSAIAWHLAQFIISRADFYLDLHSGGVACEMPSMAGYDASDPRSRDGALAFGAEVIWAHPDVPPGRTVSFAKSRGIPFLYTEAFGAGRIHPADLAMMKRGVRNLLRKLGILSSSFETVPLRYHLFGEGNVHSGVNAPRTGFFLSDVQLLDRVEAGQRVGRMVTESGELVQAFDAPSAGVIGLLRRFPVVAKDDPLFLIAQVID